MRIIKFQVENYKGFRDSGTLSFGSNVNVLVGQNNSGKTALLEALQFAKCPVRPYRGLSLARDAGVNPSRVMRATVSASGAILKSIILRENIAVDLPVPADPNAGESSEFAESFFSDEEVNFSFVLANHGEAQPEGYPSHQRFKRTSEAQFLTISPSPDRQALNFRGLMYGQNDSVAQLFNVLLHKHIYVFRPERLNIGTSKTSELDALRPDAQNLPAVLFKLQGNIARFERYNQHVRAILPSIHRVVVVPTENETVSIQLWTVHPKTERDDLLVKLEESGTGVGQVLAILYVAMTRTSNVIAIDEPNSFLHPGAAKKLLQILKQYDQNQYIVSTHSPELISIADPDTIHLVRWNGAESVIEQMDRSKIADMQRILSDVGVTLSDVFSADSVVWVEGPTEQECFPKIAATLAGGMPLTVSFVPLRNTGDLEAKGVNADLAWEIYERLTNGPSLLPVTLAFSFDRENRSGKKIEDILRQSKGRAHFLPRATYENYLLDSEAIQAVLAEECERHRITPPPTKLQVEEWLEVNRSKYLPRGAKKAADWIILCNAPKLLHELFQELTDAKILYHKLTHSIALTDWLLTNKGEQLSELKDYVASLLKPASKNEA